MISLILFLLWWRERARRRELEESYQGMWEWNLFLQKINDNWMDYALTREEKEQRIEQHIRDLEEKQERHEELARLSNQFSYLLMHFAHPGFSLDTQYANGPPPWLEGD